MFPNGKAPYKLYEPDSEEESSSWLDIFTYKQEVKKSQWIIYLVVQIFYILGLVAMDIILALYTIYK